MNDLVQAVLLLSGPVGAAAVWWIKRGDDAKLRGRVDECERERAILSTRVAGLERDRAEQQGAIATLTDLLRKEINVGG
jgi:hypothetical protein